MKKSTKKKLRIVYHFIGLFCLGFTFAAGVNYYHEYKLIQNYTQSYDLVSIKTQKTYGPVLKEERICELEVGERILGKGKIIRKGGEFYFKVKEIFESNNKEELK